MGQTNKLRVVKGLLGTLLCAALFSFSIELGGESYSIYLNDKLVLQKHGMSEAQAPSLALDQSASNDQLSIRYNHCGQIGKNRSITVKDEQQKVLREWDFGNVTGADVTIKGKEILDLYGKEGSILNLYYSSREIPKGRLLASIVFTKNTTATRK